MGSTEKGCPSGRSPSGIDKLVRGALLYPEPETGEAMVTW